MTSSSALSLPDEIDLADLAREPALVDDVPADSLPEILGRLEELRARLQTRMLRAAVGRGQAPEDRLLTVEEAAEVLGTTKDYLYHKAKELPFTVCLGRQQLRFSSQGIQRFIRQRQGR